VFVIAKLGRCSPSEAIDTPASLMGSIGMNVSPPLCDIDSPSRDREWSSYTASR
jgi:hypothetical protein